MLKRICVVGLASVALAACGSSSSHSSGQTVSLTRAAYVSGGSPGYRTVVTLKETIPGAGQLNMTGNGSFSTSAHTGSFSMQMTLPSAAAATAGLGNLHLEMVLVPGTIYMKMPAQLASKVPGGKPWWKINLSQAGKLAGIPGLSSLLNSSSNLQNPGQYLDFLRATAQGSVKDLGPATINGTQTTHYHAQVDLSKLPSAVPAADRAGAQQLVAALQQHGALANNLPIDVWVDSSQHIRQVELNYSQPVSGQSVAIALTAQYLDYGQQPAPTVPPAQDTLDLLKLLG